MKNIRRISDGSLSPKLKPSQFPNERLFSWLLQARLPVLASEDPLVTMFIQGMLTGERVDFIYVGGSQPGLPRAISVSFVFQHSEHGRIYIAGYCHLRSANRVFALDLAMVIHSWN
jgi:predicted DNA-binding transcriptional regulator YafY